MCYPVLICPHTPDLHDIQNVKVNINPPEIEVVCTFIENISNSACQIEIECCNESVPERSQGREVAYFSTCDLPCAKCNLSVHAYDVPHSTNNSGKIPAVVTNNIPVHRMECPGI